MTRALVGAGIGAVAIGGAAAWLATRNDDDAPKPERQPLDGGPLPSPEPATAHGPGNLAVAWWPQDIHFEQTGTDATLSFQSTVANTGGRTVELHPGDRVEYRVRRQHTTGVAGVVVGRGSAPLGRADVEPFPLEHEGHGVGGALSDLGKVLTSIDALQPAEAAIVGAGQPSQQIAIRDARKGLYVLRQEIVRADGSRDPQTFDDTRLTEFMLDGHGGILHTSSRYAG
jgi:hypothetical protein